MTRLCQYISIWLAREGTLAGLFFGPTHVVRGGAMLILTRRINERLIIGENVIVTAIEKSGTG